jgi:subtilase family serine protease
MRRLSAGLVLAAILALTVLSGMSSAALAAAPDLVISVLTAPSEAQPGSTVPVVETTNNQGTDAAGASSTRICLARDTALTDQVVSRDLAHGALAAGASEQMGGPLRVPDDLAPGTYYVGAIADVNGQVAESDENNNKKSQAIGIGLQPDLVVSSLTAPSTAMQGQSFIVQEETANQGTATSGAFTTRVCLARDAALTDQVSTKDFRQSTPVAPGGSSSKTGPLSVPADLASGDYYVGAIADVNNQVTESDETNNKRSQPIHIGGTPDLVVSALSAPATVNQGENLAITETTKNQGTADSGASSTRVVLARDAALTDLIGSQDLSHSGLAQGASEEKSGSIAVPAGLPSGFYYVGAIADISEQVEESDETNNKYSQQIIVGGVPDLVVTALTAQDFALQGDTIPVTETTKNQGTEVAGASTTRVCLARDSALTDLVVTDDLAHPGLAEGASDQQGTSLAIPADLASGIYYVGAIADVGSAVLEIDETNNKRSQQIIVGGAPDLTVSSLSAPGSALQGQSIGVTEMTSNLGTAASGASVTRICLARDAALTDQLASKDLTHTAIEAAGSQQRGGPIDVPPGLDTGTYYIGAIADVNGQVAETNENNNRKSQAIIIMPTRWAGEWHFDEGTGETATDSSGSGNDGTLLPSGSGPAWTSEHAKAEGFGLLFDGVDDRVTTADIDLPENILVRAWVKPGASTLQPQAIVSKWDPGCGGNYELVLRADSRASFRVSFGSDPCGTEYSVSSATLLVPGTWYCLAGTYDGSAISLYLDSSPPTYWPVSGTPVQNDLVTTIGRSADLGNEASYRCFSGVIDEVCVTDRVGSFYDLYPTYWSFDETEACAASGIVAGYPFPDPRHPGQTVYYYQSSWPVTRDQMAVYVARALAGGDDNVPDPVPPPSFSDVAPTFWAYKYIEYAVGQNVVQGYGDGTYGPGIALDRGQNAVFIARALVAPAGDAGIPDPEPPPSFPDVLNTFWAYKQVEYCAGRDVVKGYGDGLYHPELAVTRDQMAVYIARALQLPL